MERHRVVTDGRKELGYCFISRVETSRITFNSVRSNFPVTDVNVRPIWLNQWRFQGGGEAEQPLSDWLDAWRILI